jgi:hypothetical protein
VIVAAADAGAPARPEPTIHSTDEKAAEPTPGAPGAGMETKHVSEKQWMAERRETLSRQLKVEPADLRFSTDKQWALALRGPPVAPNAHPPRKPRPRRFQIIVVGVDGKRPRTFRPITAKGSDEPPKDLHLLTGERFVYEVAQPPPPPPSAHKKAPRLAHPPARPAGPPPRLFVIQPFGKRTRPIRCEGAHFTFTAQQDRLAFVAGAPEAGFVSVDGAQVYPRRGRSVIASDPVWSKDGHSLAFLEQRPSGPPRLVLLAEYDNPSGDTTWDLPAPTSLEGARVYWAGSGKLVVGRSSMKPIFAATFSKEPAPPTWHEP